MFAVLVSAALSQATAVPTTVSPTPAPPAPVDVIAPQQPRRICRIERDTSTRISGRRICQTVQEREAERDENQRTASEAVNRQWDRQMGDMPFSEFALPPGQRIRVNEITSRGLRR